MKERACEQAAGAPSKLRPLYPQLAVIARSASDEAIQQAVRGALDCFALGSQ
jgi:hypothetical protein